MKTSRVVKVLKTLNSLEKIFLLFLVLSQIYYFYRYVLLSHSAGKKALAYLTRERGIRMDVVKKFNLKIGLHRKLLLHLMKMKSLKRQL